MLTSYSRVTVVSGSRRVDLALPSALPVADVVPQVLRFCAPDETNGEPAELTLARVGGQSLSLSQSLAEAGVHDGDVIELRAFSADGRPAFIEDVRDAIEDSVDGSGGAWTSRSTVTFSVVTTCGLLLLLLTPLLLDVWQRVMAAGPAFTGGVDPQRVASASVTAVVVLAIGWAGTRWAASWSPYICLTASALWALAAGTELASRSTSDPVVALASGLVAATVIAALGRLFTPRATPLLAACVVVLTSLAVVVVAQSLGADTGVVVRVVMTLAVLGIGVMPRLSIAVGGLSSADYRVRNAGRMSEQALSARFQESSGLLLGSVIGVSVEVALIGFWLGLHGNDDLQDVWDRILSVSLAATLMLRSRVFSRIPFMLAPRLAGVFILVATVLQVASDSADFASWLYAAIALVGAAIVALSILRLSDVTRARIKRLLNLVEFIVVVDLVVVTMGAVGLYDYVRGAS